MPIFEDGELGSSVRSKINAAITTVDELEAQGGNKVAVYPDRATFVAAIDGGLSVDPGTVASDGTVLYIASAGATAISDMPGWLPFGPLEPEHLGDTTGDATATLVAWGAYPGVGKKVAKGSYTMTGPVDLVAGSYETTGATFTYSSVSVVEGAMFTSSGDIKWRGGEVDGGQKVAKGFDVTGEIDIAFVEAHGFWSSTAIAYAIGATGASGGTVENCKLWDVYSAGNGTTGDGNGPARGVYKTHTAALDAPFNIRNNDIYDIWGEEGDAVQILLFDGATYPFESAANSAIAGNYIYGVSRRCIKIQASDVVVRDNVASTEGGNPPFPPDATKKVHCLSVISSNNAYVTGNHLTSGPDFETINVAQSAAPSALTGITISGNEIWADSAETAVFVDGASGAVIASNVFNGSGRAIAISNCTGFNVSGNTFRDAVRDGTNPEIRVTSTCSRGVIADNQSVSGDKYALVQNDAQTTVVRNNAALRSLGDFVVIMSSLSDDSVVSGTVSALATGQALSSPAADVKNGSTSSLLSTSSGSASSVFWVSSDPTTSRATRPHARGDIAFNTSAGAEVGWRCTVSGTPGTWVSFT